MLLIMKYLYIILSLIFFQACEKGTQIVEQEPPCPTIACTMEFRTFAVQFVNTANQQVPVRSVEANFKTSGKNILGIKKNESDFYEIVNDNDKKIFSEKGDTIVVEAVELSTAKKITSEFVISGGRCACHITKLSGNENILIK